MDWIEDKIPAKKRVLQAISSFISEHGYAPTVREIGELAGLKSSATIHHYLQRLLIEGKIETDHPGSPRAIRIPNSKKERKGA